MVRRFALLFLIYFRTFGYFWGIYMVIYVSFFSFGSLKQSICNIRLGQLVTSVLGAKMYWSTAKESLTSCIARTN